MAIGRSNTPLQVGQIVNGGLTGTGSAATLLSAPAAALFADIQFLILSGSAADSTPALSDGVNTYNFCLAAGGNLVFQPTTPLKATKPGTGWTLTCATTTFAVVQGVILSS